MTERIGFVVVPDFPFYGLFPAIEALRVANHNSGKRLYEWCLISVDGKPVKATNGMSLAVDYGVASCPRLSICFAVSGNHPLDHRPKPLLGWLRQVDRHGTILGAFDSGVFLLAAAGLLDNQTAVVHWEIAPTLQEHYPSVSVSDEIYRIDKHRITCAGGSSTVDLMLTLIARSHGSALAEMVANGLVHRPHRAGNELQLRTRPVAAEETKAIEAITKFMSANLTEPRRIADIARRFRLSQRKLEGLFARNLGVLPAQYYLNLRMERARELLFYSTMPVNEIATISGFSSPSVFCRAFGTIHKMSPRAYRQNLSVDNLRQLSSVYGPEGVPQIVTRREAQTQQRSRRK